MNRWLLAGVASVLGLACGGAASEPGRPPKVASAAPAASAPAPEVDSSVFCANSCSSTSEPCLVRARRDAEAKEGRTLKEDEAKSLELFCGVTKARCKRKCGEEGEAGFAAANAPRPPEARTSE